MRRICVVITARASYGRIRSALQAIRDHSRLELQLVVCASAVLERYGDLRPQLKNDNFVIDAQAFTLVEGETLLTSAKSVGLGVIELGNIFDRLRPDAVVTIADRFETIATALAACNMNIPLVHVQGGEITGNIDEKIRHAITKLSDLHLVSTEKAQNRVIQMGENPASVFVTGCPSIDLAASIVKNPKLGFDPIEKYGGVGSSLSIRDGYLVVLNHPVTTEFGQARQQVQELLLAMHDVNLPVLWFWPNVDAGSDDTSKGIRAFRENQNPTNIHFFKNMAASDFLSLLINSKGLIGNSSVGIRECSFMGVPVVNIGSRQEGRDRVESLIDVGYKRVEIVAAVNEMLASPRPARSTLYGKGGAGKVIADLLAEEPLSIEKRLAY